MPGWDNPSDSSRARVLSGRPGGNTERKEQKKKKNRKNGEQKRRIEKGVKGLWVP
jgi:hypothetical protein